MQSTLRRIQSVIFGWNNLILWFSISIICVLVAPFNTDVTLNLPQRIAYWFILNGITMSLGTVLMVAMNSDNQPKLSFSIRTFIGSLLTAVIVWICVWLLNGLFFDNQLNSQALINLFAIVVPIAFVICLVVTILLNRISTQQEEQAEDKILLLKRLPVHLGRKLLHLSTQDHYVKVVTQKGSHMLLMRFSDALKELENADGIQIHRSHWVAKDAVTDTKRDNGKLILITSDGEEFPVSRSFLADVKAFFRV